MAQLNPNPPFTSWSLTSQEILQGSILGTLQKQCIQNQISSYAMERLALDIDPSNVLGAVQAEAAIKGRISALQYLLDLSVTAEEQLIQERNAPESGFGY